ncbi:MAG: DUF1622 domain-containing protein [Pseudomonadota bacterium]
MHSGFEVAASFVAVAAELAVTLLIAIGILDASYRIASAIIARSIDVRSVKDAWLHLAGWILLALEFALAADIVRTSISPSWEDVGKLAAIAAIRTLLSVFLDRDIDTFERRTEARSATPQVNPG